MNYQQQRYVCPDCGTASVQLCYPVWLMAEAAEHAATENEHEPTREALLALASSFRKTEDMIQRRIHP